MQQDNIISVLIGLVGACNNNAKTENTDRLILTALAAPDGSNETQLIEQLRAEKNIIAPDCATCSTPCGNTSDYDMKRMYNAEPTIRDLKQRVLAEIRQLATSLLQNDVTLTDGNTSIFYKTLSYVSYDLKEQTLLELLTEIQRTKLQMGLK
ncbi:MAG: hypothetical protein J1F65_04945 [Clostridiales bacterium]|nr:hypothetical protein [Clostridiales bacterium]